MVEVIDYRVSRIVVLCKDCGQDVGLYPARHKCGIPTSEALILPKKSSNLASNSKSKILSGSNNNSENYNGFNIWNKFLSATTIYNAEDDSDNESEKDDWDGETHVSRILREHYENKGGDLPDWLYDSNSLNQTNDVSKRQALPNRNNENSSFENYRDRNPRLYNDSTRETSSIQNRTSLKMDRSKYKSIPSNSFDRNNNTSKMDKSRDKSTPPPNSFDRSNNTRNDKYYTPSPKHVDSKRITDDQTNIKNSNHNSLPSRRQQSPFPRTPDEYVKNSLSSKKSYNQLNSKERHYDNTSYKSNYVNSNHDIRRYNNNVHGIPLSSSRIPNRLDNNYF